MRNKVHMRGHPLFPAIFLASFFTVTGCGTGTDEHAADNALTPAPVSERQDSVRGPELELDHGERWVVDPPMLVPVRRMQQRIAQAAHQGALLTPEHAALADSLFADLDDLVAGCTMEGKAHEELHVWLIPHMQLVQDLEKAADTTQARAILQRLADSATEFDRYFR